MKGNTLKRNLEDFEDIKGLFDGYSTHLASKFTTIDTIIQQRMKMELSKGIFFDSTSEDEDQKSEVY